MLFFVQEKQIILFYSLHCYPILFWNNTYEEESSDQWKEPCPRGEKNQSTTILIFFFKTEKCEVENILPSLSPQSLAYQSLFPFFSEAYSI